MPRLVWVRFNQSPLSACWWWWWGLLFDIHWLRCILYEPKGAGLHARAHASLCVEGPIVLVGLPGEEVGLYITVDLWKGDADGAMCSTTVDEQVVVVDDVITRFICIIKK